MNLPTTGKDDTDSSGSSPASTQGLAFWLQYMGKTSSYTIIFLITTSPHFINSFLSSCISIFYLRFPDLTSKTESQIHVSKWNILLVISEAIKSKSILFYFSPYNSPYSELCVPVNFKPCRDGNYLWAFGNTGAALRMLPKKHCYEGTKESKISNLR